MAEFFGVPGYSEAFIQLVVALVLGMLLGVQRKLAGKTAGMRTYGLVSMGACLFVVTSTFMVQELSVDGTAEIMRVVAGVISGIGFIGAGIIFKGGYLGAVTGITTAAGLWVVAGIGVAVGFKLYALSAFATILTLLAFTIFWYLEREVEEVVHKE
jgi:putative Mg2+ transporter-C (MgtC) family protein